MTCEKRLDAPRCVGLLLRVSGATRRRYDILPIAGLYFPRLRAGDFFFAGRSKVAILRSKVADLDARRPSVTTEGRANRPKGWAYRQEPMARCGGVHLAL